MASKSAGHSASNALTGKLDASWDVDAGWDEPPESEPVASTSIPPATESVDGAWGDADSNVAPPMAAAPRIPAESHDDAANDGETLRPNNVELMPSLSPRRRTSWMGPLAAAAVLVIGVFAAWNLHLRNERAASLGAAHAAAKAQAATLSIEASRPKPEPQPSIEATRDPSSENAPIAAEAAAPAPATSAVQPSNDANTAPAAEGAAASAANARVTVHIVPKNAAIFEHGKRIGTGTAEVSVAADETKTLVALVNGYNPKRFKVSAAAPDVTISLVRAPAPTPDDGSASSSDDSAAAAPPASTEASSELRAP